MSDNGIGERRLKTKRNKRLAICAAFGVVGLAVGLALGYFDGEDGGSGIGTLPPLVAVVLSGVMLLSGLATLYWYRRIDEVAQRENLLAMAAGAAIVLLVYSVWYLLWKGQIATEPSHIALMVTLYLSALATYAVRKLPWKG